MSQLLEFLQSSSKGPDSFRLQQMGRTAATAFAEQNVELNHTIRGLAKEAGLNSEQIKRVAESANNEAFLHKFRQPFDQNISFVLADSNSIARDIHAQVLDTLDHVKTAGTNYSSRKVTTRYIPGSEAYSLEKMFGGRCLEKVASHAPGPAELMAAYISAKDTHDCAYQVMQAGEERILAKFAMLSRVVEQESRCGEPNWAIGAAVAQANPSKELYDLVQQVLGHAMEPCSLQKVAQMGQELQPDNAITGLVQDLEQIMQKLTAAEDTVQRTAAQIQELLTVLNGQPEPNPANELFQEQAQQPVVQQMQAAQPSGQGQAPTQGQPGQTPQPTPPQGM